MTKEIKLVETVAKDLFRFNFGFVSMYFIRDGKTGLCVDAGMRPAQVMAGFLELGIDCGSVEAVFLTHSDRDHTGGQGLFSNARIFLAADEEQMISGKTARFLGMVRNKSFPGPITFLRDGEIVTIGNRSVEAISTPGHTPGSMSFLIDGRWLFVGDALDLREGRVALTRTMMTMDKAQQKESVRKLAGRDGVEMMLTAHSGFTNDFKHAMEEWRKEGNAKGKAQNEKGKIKK